MANRGKPVDPTRPITNIASSWDRIRADAGVQLRLHDLRHGFVTRLLEAGVPENTVMAMVGHIDPTILRRYAHVRDEAMRKAIQSGFGLDTDNQLVPTRESPEKRNFGSIH